ncbi:carbohydrate kinase FGGY [Kribbella flavida DSM 17836]|uniref:Carbohydrate kinase FGGY n=1 Tax=Kribbella flavida (strain DSM 17836 / JCM 10339 / NBRC 14399) TaxID=479435 RepID=D2PZS1_KRIFD|nr:FGGY-family carbohydrate kinase [Kribbella flavida]ADB35637.1 carbohydrate kinase FGGY [Kribbella flavida DSM 17836]
MDVGVDVGTTVTKAVAFDEAGRQVAEASRPTRLVRPGPGRFEHDTDEIVASVNEVVAELVAATGVNDGLLAVTAQGDGLWLVDAAGKPVRPAISWLDARSGGILERWTADGVAEQVFRRSGNRMFPGASGPLLAAVLAEEPDVLGRAATAAYCKDVVMQRLTGVRATDVSDASAPFLDPRTGQYDAEALAACGLTDWQPLLAPVAPDGPVGELIDTTIGLPAGTRVSAGPYDLPAAAIGAGVTEVGDALLTVGTTLACQVVTRDLPVHGEPAGLLLSTWTPGVRLRAMPAMVGTAALDQVLKLIGATTSQLQQLLTDSPPGANGVTVLPYLSEAGERAPFVDTRARGTFDGISVATTQGDLVRATCEGIAYAARHCLDAAGWTGRVTVCGGGARSSEWTQILADVLNAPLHTAEASQVAARGAVIAAKRVLGPVGDEWIAETRQIDPDPHRAAQYAEGYAHYLRRIEAARPRWADPAPVHRPPVAPGPATTPTTAPVPRPTTSGVR